MKNGPMFQLLAMKLYDSNASKEGKKEAPGLLLQKQAPSESCSAFEFLTSKLPQMETSMHRNVQQTINQASKQCMHVQAHARLCMSAE
jgi:hypothetical protein